MRRLRALLSFTVGYAAMALLSPAVAAVPALPLFCLGAWLLVREAPPRDAAEAIARELARR